MLLVDAANVVGTRPDGWWRDRPAAARRLVDQVSRAVEAGRLDRPVSVILEGEARRGVPVGDHNGVTVLHAPSSGDDLLLALTADATSPVRLVTADRALRQQAQGLGAHVVGPRWLIDLLDG